MSTSSSQRPAGIVCPIVTPLTSDGGLDEAVFRELIEALVPDLDGLFVLGSSGELTLLQDETAVQAVRTAVDQVAKRIPVYVGVGDTGLARTLARAERLAGAGVDGVVVTPPFYYPVTGASRLVWYFETIADRLAVPVVLYNIPQNTQVSLPPDAVRILAGHPNIVGIKDSAGDPFAFEEFLALRSDGFSVLQGREQLAASSLWSGADGVISAMGNFAPRLLRALVASVRDDRPRAESFALQAAISRVARVFDQAYWLSGLKATLQELGWAVGDPSPPIAPYDAGQRAAVRAIVTGPDAAWLTSRDPG
jgi:dihydrodipicolinate synthase/N-acetylneuraminate lyase